MRLLHCSPYYSNSWHLQPSFDAFADWHGIQFCYAFDGAELPFFNKTMLTLYHLGSKSSGYAGLAFRHPTICFPILSINWLNSACFFIDTIFISTQRRISNFNNSKSSKNSSRYALFSFALLALYMLLTSCMLSLFTLLNTI